MHNFLVYCEFFLKVGFGSGFFPGPPIWPTIYNKFGINPLLSRLSAFCPDPRFLSRVVSGSATLITCQLLQAISKFGINLQFSGWSGSCYTWLWYPDPVFLEGRIRIGNPAYMPTIAGNIYKVWNESPIFWSIRRPKNRVADPDPNSPLT